MYSIYLHTCTLLFTFLAVVTSQAQPLSFEVGVGGFRWMPWSSFQDVSGIPGPQTIIFNGSVPADRFKIHVGANLFTYGATTLGVNVSYMPLAMRYVALERAPIALQGGGIYLATLQHDIDARFDVIGIGPRATYKPLSWLSLQASLPLTIVYDAKYTQVMKFSDPTGLTFVDGKPEQVTGSGRIVNMRSIIPAVAIHASTYLPMNASRTLALTPRIGYQQALISMTSDGAYRLQGIEATIGVTYTLATRDESVDSTALSTADTLQAITRAVPEQVLDSRVERDTVVELRAGINEVVTELVSVAVDTVREQLTVYRRIRETYRTSLPKPPSVLRGSLVLQFVDDDGTIMNNARLTATRVASQRTVPVVPYIVFDSMSAEIPSRYLQLSKNTAQQYQEQQTLASEQHWHYHVLNIIGSRMRAQKQRTCQLQLYAAATDTVVGNARLRAVRSYICSRFGVDETRISIVSPDRGLVERDTTWLSHSVVVSDPTGKLLAPLQGQVNFVEARLPTVRVQPDAISEAGIQRWRVLVVQSGVERYAVADSTSELHDVTIDLNAVMSADAAMRAPLSFILQLQDTENTTTQSDPAILSLTSKALRPSERATPIRRTETLRLEGGAMVQQQGTVLAGQRIISAPAWSTKGLAEPEMILYESGAKVYIQEERQP